MSDILRQVDEDLRKEKLFNLWKKYRLFLALFTLTVVVLVVGYQMITSIDKLNNEKLIEKYIKATNEKNISQQLILLQELTNSNNEYLSSLADLKISNLLIESKNIDEGLFLLEEIIKNENYDSLIRDLANYLLLMKRIDEFSDQEFMDYINNLNTSKSNFKFLFDELVAIKRLLSEKKEESKIFFQELIDSPDTPRTIKIRAEKFLKIIN